MTEVSCILITSYQEDLNLDKWAEVLFVRFLYSKVTAPFLTSLLGGSKSLSTDYTQAWRGWEREGKLNSWSGEGICIIWNSSVLEMYLFSLLPSSFTTSFPLSFSSLPSFTICNNLFFLGMDTGKVLYNLDYSLILHYFIATNVPASVIGSSFRLAPVFFDMHCPFDL